MQVSIKWLRQYVEINESPEELADILSMLGLEAEVPEKRGFTGIVIGHVLKAEKHPNADRLKLCVVSDGTKEFQVVCGAPNVDAGQNVPFARVGAVLGDDFKITKTKIRGEYSYGMICSESELGLSDNQEGIMVLDENAKPGTDFNDYLSNQEYLEIDLTPNRPDCMSHFGVARDIAAKTGRHINQIVYKEKEFKSNNVEKMLTIHIDDPDSCPRYVAGIVKNIHVGPSPDWMKAALESAGKRSINNIVDISNYVLLEMGHPTHIFDYDKIPSKTISIRKAKKGETVKTLDEVDRKLTDQLLITDGKHPIAIAGVMGGYGTAVSESSKNVLIESAYFDPITIRLGAKSLCMTTDASKRFERGADPNGALNAYWRVVELLEDLAGGEWVPGVIDAYPKKMVRNSIALTREKVDILAGVDLSDDFIQNTLSSLEIVVDNNRNGTWTCTPPSFRPDLEREVDLIEELCRMYGYDHIPASFHYEGLYDSNDIDPEDGITRITTVFSGLGFNQCYLNSLTDEKTSNLMGNNAIVMKNPLSSAMSHLRTSLFPGLLQTLNHNIHNGFIHLRLFEIGNIYNQENDYTEQLQLVGIIHGEMQSENIHGEAFSHSFYTLKSYISGIFSNLNLPELSFKTSKHNDFEYGVSILYNNAELGYGGKLNHSVLKELDIDAKKVFGFQIYLQQIIQEMNQSTQYKSIIPFPKVERDLNFVMDEKIEADDVILSIKNAGGPNFKSAVPKNIFRHESFGKNKKSITFNIMFQNPSKTLEEAEINSVINDITAVVEKDFSAKLRDQKT
ncbi:MAG: phenylalanine--tRNA ligase subunit beta [Candidatus Marinimicrobia bacterium]|nr:phenylalanine--tRNA ligase subunit beta [Candidatus Neomarinimicrobiota bacterium]